MANELEWIRKNPKARQAKSKARINAYEELLAESGKEKITQAHISIPMTDRLGDLVVEANGISKGYGDRLLIDNLSFKVPKGAIVGIIGPNGAGKTTLFRMITGQESLMPAKSESVKRLIWAMLTSLVKSLIRTKPCGRKFQTGWILLSWAKADAVARLCRAV